MLIFKSKKTEDTTIDELITQVQNAMIVVDPNTQEFAQMNEQLDRLYKAKSYNKESRVSADAALSVAANILGIGLILSHERLHIVTTKALSFIMKTKI